MEDRLPETEKLGPDAEGFEGARWVARLISAYAGAMNFDDVPDDALIPLVVGFQDRVLVAILDPNMDADGLLRIVAPSEFALRREREAKLAEREAKLKAGG